MTDSMSGDKLESLCRAAAAFADSSVPSQIKSINIVWKAIRLANYDAGVGIMEYEEIAVPDIEIQMKD